MRTLLYTLAVVLLASSCRNLEKMVERGEYDEAIIYATRKLAGKKNKKTKHVQGLEEAFSRINQRDMDRITYLNGPENPQNWEEITDVASLIQRRQDRITPFLPLISKDGYEGYFEMIDAYQIKTEAQEGAAAFYYKEGKDLLDIAITQSKKNYARQAYNKFEKVQRTKANYKDTYQLMLQAKELGIVHILVEVDNNSYAYLPKELQHNLGSINTANSNNVWRKYHMGATEKEYDYKAILELTEIDVSPERETITKHTDEKRVKDGWTYKKGKNGKPVLDSLGKKIKVDKFIKVKAYVTEIHREKATFVKGQMRFVDLASNTVRASRPLSVEAVFSDYASHYKGDKRALGKQNLSRLKPRPVPFPEDLYMIADAADKLKYDFMSEVAQVRI